jgi:hypothetical protein
MSNTATPRSYWQVTLVVFTASLVFGAFFQISKKDPFVTANPFADDPYDAVGSIAIQAAAGIGLLTLARLVHSGVAQGRYILRGNLVVLLSIAVTLVSDALAVVLHPAAWDTWEGLSSEDWRFWRSGYWPDSCCCAAPLDRLCRQRIDKIAGP